MDNLRDQIQTHLRTVQNQIQSVQMPEVNLNCIRDIKFPVNYAIQSMDLQPCEKEAGLVSVTLRASGQIRVVHGNAEIHDAIKESFVAASLAEPTKEEEKPKSDDKETDEDEKKEEPDEQESEEKKEDEDEAGPDNDSSKGKDEPEKVDMDQEKNDPETKDDSEMAAEAKVQKESPVWVYETGEDSFNTQKGIMGICGLMEKLTQLGWEVTSTGQFSRNPGYELGTWTLKKTSTLTEESDVVAIVMKTSGSIEVVGTKPQILVNNVVKAAVETVVDISKASGDDNKEEEDNNDKGEKEKLSKQKSIKDDPDCSAETELEDKEFDLSMFVLEVSHLMFCRQWKLISAIATPYGNSGQHETMLFSRDSRILPALGQEGFSMIQLEKPDRLRHHHLNEDTIRDVKNVVKQHWCHGMESRDPKCFKLGGDPWIVTKTEEGQHILSAQALVAKILLALNKKELNVYGKITLDSQSPNQKTTFLLRQSNITYSRALILQPRGLNKLAVFGSSDEELEIIRNILNEHWPYPLTRDFPIEKVEGINSDEWQLFKVKRYPWIVSYGNKHLDKAMETAKEVLNRRDIDQFTVPPPRNMDSDSAKSLLIFLIQELGELGWKLQVCGDICSTLSSPIDDFLPLRPTDANALIFLL